METKTPTFKKIFSILKKLFSSHRIVFFISLILLPLVFIGVIFYLYAWEVKPEDQTPIRKISVDLGLYQSVMDKIKIRELNFQQEENRTYVDPF